jgi:hypothetical protein
MRMCDCTYEGVCLDGSFAKEKSWSPKGVSCLVLEAWSTAICDKPLKLRMSISFHGLP